MKTLLIVAGLIFSLMPLSSRAAVTVGVFPQEALQGDPVMITVNGTTTGGIKSGAVNGAKIYFFSYAGKPAALYGVDINQKIGTSTVTVKFSDGSEAVASFMIAKRARPQEFLAIPVKLGGNSVSNQARVVSILSKENRSLAAIYSRHDKSLWSASASAFVFPVASSTESPLYVTTPYGYSRDSGAAIITHKGVDFRASLGTPVYAVNRGVVRTAKTFVVYGKSVVIDHGLGLLSMYMHLSKMTVVPGQLVLQGQLIGYSGDSGYSEGAHLHLSVRIGGLSIDPIKFFELFGMR